MTWEGWVALGVVALSLYALARNLAATDTVLVGAITIFLVLSQFSEKFPTPRTIAAQFGNEGIMVVGALFVVAAALTETGALSMLTDRVLGRPRLIPLAQLRLMAPVAVMSAFINNTPVVAMFIPVIREWCRKNNISPSKLYLPLSYAAILGGSCTLIGTSTNLVVQGQLVSAHASDASIKPFGFWTLGAVGLPCAIVGVGYLLIVQRWLLPDRPAPSLSAGDPRKYTVEMLVQPGSSIIGQTIEAAGLRHLPGAYLMQIDRADDSIIAVGPEEVIREGDRLIFVGVVESVVDLQRIRGLVPATNQVFKLFAARHDRVLIEAVVSPANPLVGQTIREGRFRNRYNAVIIAVHRDGARINAKIGDIVLEPGDSLLIEAHPNFYAQHRHNREFFLVSQVEDSHPRRHDKAWIALLTIVGVVIAMTFEAYIPVVTTALVGAGVLVLTRCIRGEHARRSVEWSTLIAIGAAFGVGKTMETTGAAQFLGDQMVAWCQPFGAWGVLAGVYLTTLIFTEVVTNNAAAALAFPIARAAATAIGADFMPFAICIAIAASAGFATPLGYQTHLMIYGPGGYRFSDFLKIGVPLDLIVMLIAVALAPVFFPF